jgi:hypothetical protein
MRLVSARGRKNRSRSLSKRVAHIAKPYLPLRVQQWCGRAATVLEGQLRDNAALPHSALVVPAARALGLRQALAETLGAVLDLLQTAIDVADNVADRAEDAATRAPMEVRYALIPPAALTCLPSLLVGVAVAKLHDAFDEKRFRTSYCCRRALGILGNMATGQGIHKRHARHRELVSGEQGLLLCLPFWLVSRPGPGWRRQLSQVEAWAYRFGLSWELRQEHLQLATSAAASAYRAGVEAARRCWPTFGPFVDGGPLSARNLVGRGLC